MEMLNNIRSVGFWAFDVLRGGIIKNDYLEIQRSLNNTSILSSTTEQLKYLLDYSIANVPYYSNYQPAIEAFPVVDKSIIKNDWNRFISKKNNIKNLKLVTTSGSTGTPFSIYVDRRKRIRNYADTIYFSELAGYRLENLLLYLKIWVSSRMAPSIVYKIENICPIDVLRFSEKEINFLLKIMERKKCSILAYASVLDILSIYLKKNDLYLKNGKLKSIIAISESLSEETKRNLSERTGVCVVSRYSNLECGIIAQQQTDFSSKYLINRASYYIEILKMDCDLPVEIGELGRIVVTDLYNFAQPMIRYDTGDVGAFEDYERQFFSIIEGRKLDLLYNTKGCLISSYLVYKNMWQYNEIDQYQLIQEGKTDYNIVITAKNGFLREKQLKLEFISYLGADANIRIEYVDHIPLLASGKRKKIVNNWIK